MVNLLKQFSLVVNGQNVLSSGHLNVFLLQVAFYFTKQIIFTLNYNFFQIISLELQFCADSDSCMFTCALEFS